MILLLFSQQYLNTEWNIELCMLFSFFFFYHLFAHVLDSTVRFLVLVQLEISTHLNFKLHCVTLHFLQIVFIHWLLILDFAKLEDFFVEFTMIAISWFRMWKKLFAAKQSNGIRWTLNIKRAWNWTNELTRNVEKERESSDTSNHWNEYRYNRRRRFSVVRDDGTFATHLQTISQAEFGQSVAN